MIAINELQYSLRLRLSIVRDVWSYKAKGWVTSIWATDIDNDGDIEIVAGSKDGRIYVLTKAGDERWKHIVGNKAPVETIVAIPSIKGRENVCLDASDVCARVLVGTRDGKVYAFDKDGNEVAPHQQHTALADDGNGAISSSPVHKSWYSSSHVLRSLSVNLEQSDTIFIGSEDRCVHTLNYYTGQEQKVFETQGWVRAISLYTLPDDKKSKILVGSDDKYIYILDQNGTFIKKENIQSQIHAIFTSDIDNDGQEEILLGTDGKDLIVLTPDLQEKWTHHFPRRLLAVYAADLNNDGYAEILVSSEDKYLYLLDHQGKQIWRHLTDHRIFSLCATSLNKDGLVEVIAGGEDRISAFQFAIINGMEKEIRRLYQNIEKYSRNEKYSHDPLKNLSVQERTLLQHIIETDVRKHVTLKRVEEEMNRQEYVSALSALLQLKQQEVQILWQRKIYKSKGTQGHIRALCLGDISGNTQLEVIVGTDDGKIHAFTASGRLLWSFPLMGQVTSVQTGYRDHGRWEEIVVCTTNDKLYIVNGTKWQKTYKPEIQVEKEIKWATSHYVNTPTRGQPFEILIGTEDKKIYVCKDNIDTLPDNPIETDQGIKILCLYEAHHTDDPEIIAGSNENKVYAYTREGQLLWEYLTRDRIQAICIKDIDNDRRAEILIGSEDCNIHVINGHGQLKWRYYLPHRVLSIDCAENKDGSYKVFVGCGDGCMYVFNKDGDLLWKYEAKDLIRAIRIADINEDGQVEITLGSEDQLEILQVLDIEKVQALIDECLYALQSREGDKAIDNLQRERDAGLRAFALQKQLEQTSDDQTALTILTEMLDDHALEVRKVLIQEVMHRYTRFPGAACSLLDQLATIPEQEVRLAFIGSLDLLIRHNQDIAYNYLMNFAGNTDRFVRRAVVRELHQLIGDKQIKIKKEFVLDMLILLSKKKDSEWVQQEAARTLAHFFDTYPELLLAHIYKLILKGTEVEIFRHIGFNAKKELVQKSMEVLLFLIEKADESNVPEVLEKVVPLLATMQQVKYGRDTWTIYKELQHLFSYRTVDAIAQYRCTLPLQPTTEANQHFNTIAPIFRRLNIISRRLQLYVRRSDINDRFPVLMETLDAIGAVEAYIEKQYNNELFGETMQSLPDRKIFGLLLQRWQAFVQNQLHGLKGKAELVAELQTKITRQEELVGIWLAVKNHGRISASNIQITLLHNDQFEIVGNNMYATDIIFAGETLQAEFTITPHSHSLDLVFEIAYDESTGLLSQEERMRVITFGDRLELQNTERIYTEIPNPYSPGIPPERAMFYGRDSEIAFLKENLTRTTAKTVLVLYGQRRSGKTTLLLHLMQSSMTAKQILVFFDMQAVSYKLTDGKLFYKLAFQLNKSLEEQHIVLKKPELHDFEADPTFAFTLFLDALEPHLQGHKIIFLIDEFEGLEEQVKKGRLEPEIFEYLRNLMQHRPYINVLLSGTHQIKQLTQEYWSVFFNTAFHYRLKKLSEKGAYDLIQLPVENFLEYERHAAIKIRQLAGDQPYFIQLLCHALVNHCNERRKSYVTVNDVNSVLDEVMQTGEIQFGWLWKQLSPAEQIALSTIAEGSKDEGRFLSFADIQELYSQHQLPCKQEQIEARLQALHDADIIERADDKRYTPTDSPRFRISVGLMRIWLRKEKPFASVLNDE